MSAHKKQVTANSSGIVVGDGKHHRHYGLHARLAAIVVALLIVLGGVIWGVVALVDHHRATTAAAKLAQAAYVSPAEKAQRLSTLGDSSQAQSALDQQLAAATTKQAKADIYAQQATVAINAASYQQANGYALKAEQLLPSASTAYMLAHIAELSSDNKSAAKYLQQAIDRLNKSLPQYQLTLRSYQSELQGLQQ